jgi:hypothetical protein
VDPITAAFDYDLAQWEGIVSTLTGPAPDEFNVWHYTSASGRRIDERDIPYQVRPWRPFIRTMAMRPDGSPDPEVLAGREEFWANGHYLVYIRTIKSNDPGEPDAKHLSLRTVENDTRHDWRDFQRIKNELVGPHWEAVELYPDVDRLVDSANQYHLWCFPFRLPFGFDSKLVMPHGAVEQTGGKQRPFTEGDQLK